MQQKFVTAQMMQQLHQTTCDKMNLELHDWKPDQFQNYGGHDPRVMTVSYLVASFKGEKFSHDTEEYLPFFF